jgi:membrane-associated phospholipid phosphatase
VPRQWRLIFWWALAPLGIAVLFWLAFGFDQTVSVWISAHQSHALKGVMKNVSRFGDWLEHFVLGLLLLAIAWRRGNRKWMCVFLSMLIALSLAGLAARAIKISTGRARPSVKTEHVWNGPQLSSRFHAFPSGHVASSSAFFGVLLFVSWRIGLVCLSIPIVIGFSRIYIGAHYLSDVLFAAILGIVCACLIARLMLRREIENIVLSEAKPNRTDRQSNIEN